MYHKFRRLLFAGGLLLIALVFSVHAQDQTPEADLNAFASWSPDGMLLAVANGTTIQIVDVTTTQTINYLSDLLEQVTAPIWSPDSSRLAVANGSNIEIWHQPWDIRTASLETTLRSSGYIRSMAWNPQDNRIAVVHDALEVWDLSTGTQVYSVYGHRNFITQVSWSPDGIWLATASADRSVKTWNAATGDVLSTVAVVRNSNLPVSEIFAVATSVSWSPDSIELVFGAEDGTARLWNTTELSGNEVRISENSPGVFRTNEAAVEAVAWNPTRREVVSGSRDGLISIWDIETGDQLQSLQTNIKVYSISYSPYGGRLAISGRLSSQTQVDTISSISSSQSLVNGAVQIVVPAPSLERLQTIANACNAPAIVVQTIPSSIDQLTDFVAEVEALPENTILSACAADLIAVAEALQSQ